MKYRVTHTTAYAYSIPASLSQNEVFLTPRNTPNQNVLSSELRIVPTPQYMHRRVDYFGNTGHLFMVQHPHENLRITAISQVDTSPLPLPEKQKTLPWEQVVERLHTSALEQDVMACQYCFASPMIQLQDDVFQYAARSFVPGVPILEAALDIMQRIYADFEYDKDASTVDTSVSEVLGHRKGVCQDFAHLGISCLRSHGLAARYVSGYLETIPPQGQPKLVGADASHAWFAVYIPDHGWVDCDPTNNMVPNDTYVTVAWGRDYSDVAPAKGVVTGGGVHDLTVQVDVARLL
ncbi:transglutaminase family protein [Desulfogranum japonicum]|uniref:transglutaminase family protein n=1 Tax=Desulfogranum japonicum TaxID=231447 RepID=UPI00041CC128|nr:transglutaminase family protein [Desulfogranum japonicum]